MELTIDKAMEMGVAAHKAGRLQDAERLYQAILKSYPLHPDANHNLGILAVAVNKTRMAIPLFKNALEANPRIEQFWLSYINALIIEEKINEARKSIKSAHKHGVSKEKLKILKSQTIEIKQKNSVLNQPSQKEVDQLLGYYHAGKLAEALKLAKSLSVRHPEFPLCWKVLASLLRVLGHQEKALDANQKAIKLQPNDGEAHYNLANLLNEMDRFEEAKQSYKNAITLSPDFAEAHYNLGNVYLELDDVELARDCYLRATELKSDFAQAFSNLGSAYTQIGNLDKAKTTLERAIELDSSLAEAHRHLASMKTFASDDEQFAMMQRLFSVEISDEQRCHLNFALAKANEDLGNFEAAYLNYKQGNAARKKLLGYSIDQDIETFEKIRHGFEKIRMLSPLLEVTDSTPRPIFILGMPRSGTTLVEQIVSSHSEVEGAGELKFAADFGEQLAKGNAQSNGNSIFEFRKNYLDSLKSVSKGHAFVTDKMPQNFLYIGLLTKAFPEAKIVHVKRKPAAVCWANFKQFFSSKGLGYSYDLNDVVRYYNMYSELMEFWVDSLPNKIYELDYELLTSNQSNEITKLVKHIGLDWDEKCLHPQKNKRVVSTASNKQVRQKIYTGSSQKWERFKPFLNGKFDSL